MDDSSSPSVPPWCRDLAAIQIEIDPHLKGQKRFIRDGNTIYVSPAFHSLMRTATPEELQRLMEAAEVLDITAMRIGLDRPLPPQFS